MPILDRINDLKKKIRQFRQPYYFGFVRGHSYLTEEQVAEIKRIWETNGNDEIIQNYEQRFAKLIGSGNALSFAAARMGFYVTLKAFGIQEKDEVILPGFTCSVMANAVMRTGAKPIYANINPHTFGSDAEEIKRKITKQTKLIVSQHSFGIPCNIAPIVELGRKLGIRVLEDCAITLDSSIMGKKVGNWGDAAIFSTDHTKPINTIIGGLVYTRDKTLYNKIKSCAMDIPQLDEAHQARLFRRFLFERSYYIPDKYSNTIIDAYFSAAKKKLKRQNHQVTFLESDYSKPMLGSRNYPYPAKMPPFLSQIGLFELDRWPHEIENRKRMLKQYVNIISESNLKAKIPVVYLDHERDIVPLRFVFQCPNQKDTLEKMSQSIDVDWTWFRQPLVCGPNDLAVLGYRAGECSISEEVGKSIINWPCVIDSSWEDRMLIFFENVISRIN